MAVHERAAGPVREDDLAASPGRGAFGGRAARAGPRRPRRALLSFGLRPLGDLTAGGLACVLAFLLRYHLAPAAASRLALSAPHLRLYTAAFWLYLPLLVVCLSLAGAYRRSVAALAPVHVRAVAQGVTYAVLVLLMATYLFDRAAVLSRGWLLATWVLTCLLIAGYRYGARLIAARLAAAGLLGRRVLIVGTHEEARGMEWLLRRQPHLGLRVVGFVDDVVPVGESVQGGKRVVGRTSELAARVADHAVDLVLISARASSHAQMRAVVEATLGTPAEVIVSPDVFTVLKFRTWLRRAEVLEEPQDIALRRRRGLPVRDHPHVTLFGRFLRRSSLDELPQLWNVLRGQMSLVGPYKMAPIEIPSARFSATNSNV